MPQAIIAVAEWVGMAVFASLPVTVPITVAATVAEVAVIATTVLEVAAIAEVTSLLQPKVGGTYGTQVDFKADPQAGIPYAIGRTAVAGNIVFVQSAGAKSKYLNYATVYSGAGPIDSYESFLVNDVAVAFSADGGEGASGYYANRMWRTAQLGAAPEGSYLHWTSTATGETPANHAGQPTEWTSGHKLSGFAADLWALGFNADKYAAGTPKRLTVGKWVKVYDPRLDSTYPGGAGAQRLADETTWAWSENPFLHALTWLIGRRQNGKRILGVGLPTAAIDIPAFVTGANVADANGWTCGGLVYSTDDKYEVLKACLQAGGGRPMRLGAKMSCLVSAPRTSLATIVSADVVGDPTITGGVSRRARINTLWPKYREEAQAWQSVGLDAPVSVASYVTEDGGEPRSRALDYPLVQHATQVAQLAYYDIANGREFTPVVLPCKPVWMGYRPGDCITANEPEWGLNSQKLLILKRQRDPMTMQVTLTCCSETDAKHAAALALSGTGPSTPGLTGIDPNSVAQPGAGVFTAAGTALTGSSGSMPALVVTGTSDNVNAADVLVRYRLHVGPGDWIYWPAVHAGLVGDPIRIEITGVADASSYDLQVAYRSGRGAVSAWTDLGAHLAGALGAGGTGDAIPPADVSAPPTLTTRQGHDAAGTPYSYLDITWPANTDGDLQGYVIEIGDGTGTVDFFSASASFQVRGLVAGATYSAKVKAVDTSGNLSVDWTATVTDTVLGGAGEGANLVPNGGLTLGTNLWTVTNWGWSTDGLIGYFFEETANGTNLAESSAFAAVVGKDYTLSLTGGMRVPTSGDAYIDIEWLTAGSAHISYSARVALAHLAPGDPYQLTTLTVTAPATTAFARARIYTETIVWAAGGFAVMTQVKVEQGGAFTGFNDLATSGAIYADGTSIDSLKPVDAGATKNTVTRSATTPGGTPTTGDFWVVLVSGVPVALRQWNGSAWVTPADLTSSNVASGIAGQGALATSGLTDSQVNNALVPLAGVNRLRYTDFEAGVRGWAAGFNPVPLTISRTPTTISAVASLDISATATAAAQQISVYTEPDRFYCKPGETLTIQANIGTSNCTVNFNLQCFDASGTKTTTGGLSAPNGSANGTLYQNVIAVPAGTVSAYLEVFLTSVAAGAMHGKISQPMVAGAASGQSVYPAYARGASNDATADVTLTNTSAAITGQGAFATVSTAIWSTQVSGSGKPTNNADVTSANTAAAISGQGALATVSSATWSTQVTGSGKPADNADVTSSHTAAAISGQGALATLNDVSSKVSAGTGMSLSTSGGVTTITSTVTGGSSFYLTGNTNACGSSHFGAATQTTNTVTVTPHGNTGTVTYAWTNPRDGVSATSPTGATTAFTGFVGTGQELEGTSVCIGTDGGSGATAAWAVSIDMAETS